MNVSANQISQMSPSELAEAYQRGDNISALLREQEGTSLNTEDVIEIAYDLQAGSYIAAMADPAKRNLKTDFVSALFTEIDALGPISSFLEPGIGEGTTLAEVVSRMRCTPEHLHGFDISWSRISHCNSWLLARQIASPTTFVGSILRTPYADNSFDLVFTAHAVEPNGGREKEVLAELFRIASRYLVLVEPDNDGAGEEGRARMELHGYCRDLPSHAERLGMTVTTHRPLGVSSNPLNPSAITVIAKDPDAAPASPSWCCPRYRTPMDDLGDAFFAPASLTAYPKIGGIACLRPSDGVVASAYGEVRYRGSKQELIQDQKLQHPDSTVRSDVGRQ